MDFDPPVYDPQGLTALEQGVVERRFRESQRESIMRHNQSIVDRADRQKVGRFIIFVVVPLAVMTIALINDTQG